MGDTMAYRIVWEYAGMQPPDFHEEDLQAMGNACMDVSTAILVGVGGVTNAYRALHSSIQSDAFEALDAKWNSNKSALMDLVTLLSDLASGLYEAVQMIYQWKGRLVLALGGADMEMTVYYVGTAGLGALLDQTGGHVATAEIQRALKSKVDEIEGDLLNIAINGTPLRELQTKVEHALDHVARSVMKTTGAAAGHAAGGQR